MLLCLADCSVSSFFVSSNKSNRLNLNFDSLAQKKHWNLCFDLLLSLRTNCRERNVVFMPKMRSGSDHRVELAPGFITWQVEFFLE